MVVVAGESLLLQVIATAHPPRGLTGRLHSRQQQRHQDADDRDHHQQLNKSECKSFSSHHQSISFEQREED
jgi:hypothetical protein